MGSEISARKRSDKTITYLAASHAELNYPMSTLAREQPRSDMRPGSSKRFSAFLAATIREHSAFSASLHVGIVNMSNPARIRSIRVRRLSRATRGRPFCTQSSNGCGHMDARVNKDCSDVFVIPSQRESILFGDLVKVGSSRYPIRPDLVQFACVDETVVTCVSPQFPPDALCQDPVSHPSYIVRGELGGRGISDI